jgi:hypothetical protein
MSWIILRDKVGHTVYAQRLPASIVGQRKDVALSTRLINLYQRFVGRTSRAYFEVFEAIHEVQYG